MIIKFFKKLFKIKKAGFYNTEIFILTFSDSTLFNIIQFHPKYDTKYKNIFEMYNKNYGTLGYILSNKQIETLKTYKYLKLDNITFYYKNNHRIPM